MADFVEICANAGRMAQKHVSTMKRAHPGDSDVQLLGSSLDQMGRVMEVTRAKDNGQYTTYPRLLRELQNKLNNTPAYTSAKQELQIMDRSIELSMRTSSMHTPRPSTIYRRPLKVYVRGRTR